ncbi:hypothetical protein NQ318_019430 [Aromia moschata]|uniref:Uncharacterized protein n=1 Tax=Aromia moschata TaxID=1265417 RepID=A0AAV8XY96_9CUCU|nr:hypothetical protein NQ318_019430 [Aromia moschata]
MEKAVDAVREGCLKGRLRLNSTCLGYHFDGGLVESILSMLGIRASLVRLKKKQLQRLLEPPGKSVELIKISNGPLDDSERVCQHWDSHELMALIRLPPDKSVQFPVLLGRLWSGFSDSVSQNLVSGFRATGLHPPNPTEVLKRIPDGLDNAGEVVERNIDAKTELNVEEAQPNEEAGSETATMSEVSISVSINQNKPSTSASENIIKQRPVRETRKPKRVDSSICGIFRINWKHDRCNGASTDPYYNCPRCEDTDDEEVDDSEEDKDFVPSD